jgi:hypothetical protein
MNEAMPPSELVVANVLRSGLPVFFAVVGTVSGYEKIIETYRRYDAPQERNRLAA